MSKRYDRANGLKNWNCDGVHCRDPNGEVRVYPLGGSGNLILCIMCVASENKYRRLRAEETKQPENFPLHKWTDLELYGAKK